MQIGLGRADITPQGSVPMGGYVARSGPSVGVHDRLYARSFVFRDEGKSAAVLVLDFLGLSSSLVDVLKEITEEIADVAGENVLVACTHTHSGPDLVSTEHGSEDFVFGKRCASEALLAGVRQSMEQAYQKQFEARIGITRVNVSNLVTHRTESTCAIDAPLWLLRIDDTAGRMHGILANYPCHSTIMGPSNRLISADLLGYAAQQAEATCQEHPLIAITYGAAGDLSTRFTRRGQDYGELTRLSDHLATAIINGVDTVRTDPAGPIETASRTCQLPYKATPSRTAIREEIDHVSERLEAAKDDLSTGDKRILQTRLEGLRDLLTWIQSGGSLEKTLKIKLTGVRIGNAILIGVPGEPFHTLGVRLRQSVDEGLKPAVFACTNGYLGYFVEKAAIGGGSYEAQISRFDARSLETIFQTSVELVKALGGII